MNKTGIEWCDMTWNPVTGCRHECEYCYARRVAARFGTQLPDGSGYPEAHDGTHRLEQKVKGNPYPYLFEPTFLPFRLKEPERKTKPQTIFVCSMADLFGAWVPDEWIEEVFEACKKAPQHRYLFLTKNPQRYCDLAYTGKLPAEPNFWYGTTTTGPDKPFFYWNEANNFVSVEPLLKPFEAEAAGGENPFESVKWVIIGAETGNRKGKVTPEKEWVDTICAAADDAHAAVFMKDSLLPVTGEENMRRELPWERQEAAHD